MSDVQRTIDLLRVQADFLVVHRELLESVSYDKAIAAWRAEHPDRGDYASPNTEEGDERLCYASFYASYGVTIQVCGSHDAARELTRRLRRGLGTGQWEKHAYNHSNTFYLKRRISESPYCDVTIQVERDAVCTPVTEKKEVTVPAQEAREAIPEHTEIQDVVVDYDCGSLLKDEEPTESLQIPDDTPDGTPIGTGKIDWNAN